LTVSPDRGPVVVDTDVYSARLIPDSTLARRYEALLVGRAEFVSFQTVAEVRYGALLRGWGDARIRRRLVTEASEAMRSSTDSIAVALYHYMREVGLADGEDAPELASIGAGDLMTESWLLAYEAIRRGWTSGISLAQSPFFERLAADGVTFLPPTDFDEPDAISDWLDDHPPITGTVSGY
jgi:predicted nucleic acid-binding protein